MRDVFYITTVYFTPEGGGPSNRFIDMQCKGLLKEGFHIHVIAAYGEINKTHKLGNNLRVTQLSQINALKIFPIYFHRVVSYLMWTLFMAWIAVKNRPATWIFCGPALSFSIIIPYTRLVGSKTCYVDVDLFWGIHNPVNGSLVNLIRKVIYSVSIKVIAYTANHILLGGTIQLVKYFQNLAPHAQISQAWPPTDVSLFASGDGARGRKTFNIDEEVFLIVYGGSVCAREGIHILIKAFATIIKKAPLSKLFIAGRIPGEGYLPWLDYGVINFKEMAEILGLSEKIIFSGMLEKEDLIDILNSADVLVMPKIDHPYNAVAMPIKVGEYLATANPFVSSNICDLDKYFIDGKNIQLVEPDNPDLLSKKILWVYKNREIAQVIGEKGFIKAKEMFDYSSWVRGLLKAIEFKPSKYRKCD